MPTFSSAGSGFAAGGNTGITLSATVASGLTNSILIAQVTIRDTGFLRTINSVTFGGTSMTLVTGSHQHDGSGNVVEQWYMLAPAASTANIVVGTNANCDRDTTLGYQVWQDVHQTTPFGTAVTATGTSTTPQATVSSASSEVVLGVVRAFASNAASFSSGDTERWEQCDSGIVMASGGSSQVGASSVTMDWTSDNMFSSNWSASAVPLKPAASGTTYNDGVAEGSATAADSPSAVLLSFTFPVSDIAANGWLPSTGAALYPMLDETAWDISDYIYSPNNPTTQQFEVLLGTVPTSGLTSGHGVDIGLRAMNQDTNFDLNLVQGTTVLDSWTENVTVAAGDVVRTRNFSGAVISAITNRADLRIRGVARA